MKQDSTTSTSACRVCGSDRVSTQEIISVTKRHKGRKRAFIKCALCGYNFIPGNQHDYSDDGNFSKGSKPDTSTRTGDGKKPGREFFMLQTAHEILGRDNLEVLFYGSGLSKDHILAGKQDYIKTSCLTDLSNYQNASQYIPLDHDQKFDVVICCEVVEHFENPRDEFANLFRFAKPNGLVLCSTNIDDGHPVQNLVYPFLPGHVSYYTGRALLQLAENNGYSCDFRLPQCSLTTAGPRKRYIFFYQDQEIRSGVAEFFAHETYAYSEPQKVPKKKAKAGQPSPPSLAQLAKFIETLPQNELQTLAKGLMKNWITKVTKQTLPQRIRSKLRDRA